MEYSKDRVLPVGFRFRPTDFEISNYFLKNKVFGEPMETLTECPDIFSKHPCDLPGYPREEEEHWYLYSRKRKNQVTANSRNIWIPAGEESNVLDPNNNDALVGIKRPFTLVGHKEEEEVVKYNWFMDEIRLPLTVAETDWVLCHVFCKPEIESECEEEEEEESVVTES